VKVDFDYSEFLGPNYEVPEKYSSVIANHSTPIDTHLMGFLESPHVVAKAAIRNVPWIG